MGEEIRYQEILLSNIYSSNTKENGKIWMEIKLCVRYLLKTLKRIIGKWKVIFSLSVLL